MKKQKINIRSAQITDLASMQILFRDTISTICKGSYTKEQIDVWKAISLKDKNRWNEKLESQYMLLAEIGNAIVGFASLAEKGDLDLLYVHKDFQRQGIAKILYARIEREAIKRGVTEIKSEVSISAKPFFEHKGFKIQEMQKKKIKRVEIENYLMIKKLEFPLVNKKYLLKKYPGKGGWTYAAIPEILQNKKAPFGWVKVKGSIDNYEIKNSKLMPMGNGQLFLPVKAEIRKKIEKKDGDSVHIILYADNTPIEIPGELQICLEDEPKAYSTFSNYTEGEQKTIIDWIYSAKTDETKVKRIAQTLNKLLKTKKQQDN